MIEEIESEHIYDFLEQSGVKGMRWGVRKSRSSKSGSKPKSAPGNMTKSQKLGIKLIGAGVGVIGAKFMYNQMNRKLPLSLAFGAASAYAGATATRALVEKFGDQRVQVRGEVK